MPVSVEEISARAGLGRSTAYRVLSDNPKVSAEARKKVMRAIGELGYPRMRGGGKRRNGLVLWLPGLETSLAGSYVAEVVSALEAAVGRMRRGLRIISHPLPESPEDVPLDLLRENIDGILTVAFYSNRHLEVLAGRWPVVCLLSSRQVPGVVSVGPDYAGAARLAVEHLASMGHRRIVLVTGEPRERNFSRLFLDGYSGAMVKAGIGASPDLVHSSGENVGKGPGLPADPPGQRAARELLGRAERPTAIVARHDSLLGIMKTMGEMGLRVPEDVSIVGCGTEGLAGAFNPQLTVAGFSAADMASLGLEVIKAVPPQGARLLVPVGLREGASVRRLG